MLNNPDLSQKYTFGSLLDLLSTLEELSIQYLDAKKTRALIIYQTAILNPEALEGKRSAASSIEFDIWCPSP